MFERFSTKARQSIVNAQEEARRLGHAHIGTEHVLLGLLAESEGVATRVLNRLGVSLAASRSAVKDLTAPGPGSPSGHVPFTPQAKKVLELSLREALQLGHNYIGTEHILLGIVRAHDGVVMQVLDTQGAPADRVRSEVLAEVRRGGSASGEPLPRRTPGAESLIAAAQQLAGSAPMGTHHLLEAMTLLDESLAGHTLTALGVDAQALAAKIDELGVEGTSDITPDVAGARRMEISVDEAAVHIVLGDDVSRDLVTKLTAAAGNPIRGDDAADPLVGVWRAIVTALQQLLAETDPADDDEDDDGSGRTSAVRAALRNRLRRRGH
jgi:ATP-dependent Clp protease ATP-binding subunit ClpA